MRHLFLLFLISSSLFGKKVDLYADWLHTDLSQASKNEVPVLLKHIWEITDNHHQDLELKDLQKEKKYLKKIKPYSMRAFRAYFKEPKKNPEINDTLCKVFFNVHNCFKNLDFTRYPEEKMILFLWEPPTVTEHCYNKEFLSQFGRVYTWDDDLVDNQRFFKFYYPELQEPVTEYPSFKQKKLCTCICSRLDSTYEHQLYTERENAIRFFDRYPQDFDFYGRNWAKRNYQTYKGTIPNKKEVMKNYRFSICYENTQNIRGYVTEKIFDSFASMCVPVYLGASNITDYVPKECFIDKRDFSSYEELYAFLKGMTEEEYQNYLDAIQVFLKSDNARKFSFENFAKTFSEALEFAENSPSSPY